jgi:hypothetical protein
LIAHFIGIFTGVTAVVHFTNVQHINRRLVFWYHFTFDCSGPLLSGVFLALISLFWTVVSQSQSQSCFTTGGIPPISSSWRRVPWDSRPEFFFQLNTCGHSPYITLRILGDGVQTGSTRHRGHLLSHWARPGWLWGWRIIRWNEDWQGKPKYSENTCPSATLSTTNPTWPDPGLNPGRHGGKPATNRLSYGAALLYNILSNERMGLSFTIAAGPRQRIHSRARVPRPRQRSHSRVWVPLDSGPYFTVSDSRLSFPSPPTTRRVTVEVFDPASTRELLISHVRSVCYDRQTDGLEDSMSNPSISCSPMQRWLVYSLPPKLN